MSEKKIECSIRIDQNLAEQRARILPRDVETLKNVGLVGQGDWGNNLMAENHIALYKKYNDVSCLQRVSFRTYREYLEHLLGDHFKNHESLFCDAKDVQVSIRIFDDIMNMLRSEFEACLEDTGQIRGRLRKNFLPKLAMARKLMEMLYDHSPVGYTREELDKKESENFLKYVRDPNNGDKTFEGFLEMRKQQGHPVVFSRSVACHFFDYLLPDGTLVPLNGFLPESEAPCSKVL